MSYAECFGENGQLNALQYLPMRAHGIEVAGLVSVAEYTPEFLPLGQLSGLDNRLLIEGNVSLAVAFWLLCTELFTKLCSSLLPRPYVPGFRQVVAGSSNYWGKRRVLLSLRFLV
jgi:hypothetical protein